MGLAGYKRHFRNLIAHYGAYPVVSILGGETEKSQGPWHDLAQYVKAIDPDGRLLGNPRVRLREALEDHVVFDFDLDATGHNSWNSVGAVLRKTRQSFKDSPQKPFVSGESCYELHNAGKSGLPATKPFLDAHACRCGRSYRPVAEL